MLELQNEDGTLLRALPGITLDEACRIALVEHGVAGVVAMMPAVTREIGLFMILAVAADGRVSNSGMRLAGRPV